MSHQQSADSVRHQSYLGFRRAKNITVVVVLAAVMAMLAAVKPASAQVTTVPSLFPAFDLTISDYVVSGVPGSPVQVTIISPTNTLVSVDGHPFKSGTFTVNVSISAGQSFTIRMKPKTSTVTTYYVRCTPPDFPTYTVEHTGQTQAEWYILVPDTFATTRPDYVIVYDTNGVPMWWYDEPAQPLFGTLLRDGNLAWTTYSNMAVERGFDGTLLNTITPASSIGGNFDIHELIQLPNGDYVFIVDVLRGPVNLSAYGGSSTATVTDNVIEEVTPSGSLVWSWSALDHISAAETVQHWWNPYLTSSPADPYHMNAIEPDGTGTGYVISCRHLDAILYIDYATGNILWKLGGTQTGHSLSFVGDPYGNFGGQHDVMVRRAACADPVRAPQLMITLHDDGTNQNRAPRAVRYYIDEIARTATLQEMVTDPDVTSSGFAGSARRLIGGDWVISWGGTNMIAEYNAEQQSVFRLVLPDNYFSYRAIPVLPGVIQTTTLRAGMDAQFPR